MPLTLRIQFGGLCMLWQHRARRTLYVLMPAARHGGFEDEDDMNHCQYVVCNARYSTVGGTKPHWESIRGQEIDLFGIATPGRTQDVDRFARPSRYANLGGPQIPVADEALRGPLPFYLAARVILPLPEVPFTTFDEDAGNFEVPDSTGTTTKRLFGRAEVVYNDVDATVLQNLSTKLKPESEVIEIGLVNVRVKDLNNPQRYKYYKGEPWKHQQAYYSLLGDFGSEEREGPPALVAGNVAGVREKHTGKDNACAKANPATWPPVRGRFVDPYTCTLGGGCDPDTGC